MMDPVEVTARFDMDGKVIPVRFSWNGREYPIEGAGRRWQAEDGLHILVMAAGEQVFELLFAQEKGRWFIKPLGQASGRFA